jgi:chromatin remodeling complex protein RSC6
MGKDKKSTAVATAPAVVETPAPVAPAKEKKSRKSATETPAAPAPVVEVAPVVEAAPAAEGGAEKSEVETHLSSVVAMVQAAVEAAKKLSVECRALEKAVHKLEKESKKGGRKKRASTKKGEMPKGFTKPCIISEALCKFLGVPKDTKLSRNEVRKKVSDYIKANGLQSKENGQIVNPDDKMMKVFKFPKDEKITIFNIQKYYSEHIQKCD